MQYVLQSEKNRGIIDLKLVASSNRINKRNRLELSNINSMLGGKDYGFEENWFICRWRVVWNGRN